MCRITDNSGYSFFEAFRRVLGNRGKRTIFSGEQGNKGLKIRGTGEHRQFLGTGNIENQDFVFWGNKAFFRGNKGRGTPFPVGGPLLSLLLDSSRRSTGLLSGAQIYQPLVSTCITSWRKRERRTSFCRPIIF